MVEQPKSVETFCNDLFAKFTYEDFQPSLPISKLKQKFTDIFCVETPYWKPHQLPDTWRENWIAIEMRSFKNFESRVGLYIDVDSVRAVTFGRIFHTNFDKVHAEIEVPLFDIWIDHKNLVVPMTKILKQGLRYANRASYGDAFPSN